MVALVVLVDDAQPLLHRGAVLLVLKLVDEEPLRPMEIERRLWKKIQRVCFIINVFL
jgi:hypothetical protein